MLQEQDRLKLDGIVKQMVANKETDSNINLVVSDFKQKYSQQQQTPVEVQPKSVVGTLLKPTMEGVQGLKTLYGGGEQGIANKLKQDIQSGASDIQQGNVVKGVLKSGLRTAGDVAGAVYAPVGAVIGATGIGKVFDWLGELSQKGGKYNPINLITDSKMVQDFVTARPNLEEDFGRALNLAFAKADQGKIDPKTVVERTIKQVESAKAIPGQVVTKVKSVTGRLPEDIVNKRAQELNDISSNYSKLRKIENTSPEESLASRKRIASTDVLVGAVDESGVIRTKQSGGAVEQYKAQTVDYAENVVRKNLERLKETVTPEELNIRLTDAIKSSGLEGSDLTIALNKIKKEIEGYKTRADESGNIPLAIVHDAKISNYKNIDFNTPAEIKTYRKSVARGLKETIEKNSTFNVKEVNAELGKYLKDVEFLNNLDGKRVKGGKLGKYFAQISGNIIGGVAGGAIGGPVGSAVGTVIGGELGGRIKGSMLQKTLGGKAGNEVTRNPTIQNAVDSVEGNNISNRINYSNNLGNRNQQYNPSPTTNKSVTIKNQNNTTKTSNKTAPITKTSTRTINSSIPQKKGIIQRIVDKYKSIPNKQGGFIKIGGKIFKEVPEATKKEMIQSIDYILNPKFEFNFAKDETLTLLMSRYNINADWTPAKIAKALEDLIEGTKTSQAVIKYKK